jgi:type II secretory pathway pseudopilin PulG
MRNTRVRQIYRKGLSLVELLVVVALLATTSGMIVSMTGTMDDRTRHEETCSRLAEIRSAILGPDAVSAGGELLSGGYLQDVGKLPDGPDDLCRRPEAVRALEYDAKWKTWAGWRGPYLAAPPRRQAEDAALLYDDYGNDFYGWALDAGQNLPIRTCGADGKRDDAGGGIGAFERDYPHESQPLIAEADWVAELPGDLDVVIWNTTNTDYSLNPLQVRLRVVVPRWEDGSGPFDYRPSLASDEYVGPAFTLDAAPGESQTPSLGKSMRVPLGRRMLFLVDADTGQPLPDVRAYVELKLSRRLGPPQPVIYLRQLD